MGIPGIGERKCQEREVLLEVLLFGASGILLLLKVHKVEEEEGR